MLTPLSTDEFQVKLLKRIDKMQSELFAFSSYLVRLDERLTKMAAPAGGLVQANSLTEVNFRAARNLPSEPAIPINHTTFAGLLLEWPSI